MLHVNNFVILSQQSNTTPIEVHSVISVDDKINTLLNGNTNLTVVIINGKQKVITKNSAYLLDMMTLDDV